MTQPLTPRQIAARKAVETRRARTTVAPAGALHDAATLPAFATMPDAQLLETFAAIGRVVRDRLLNAKPILSSWNVVLDYLRSAMAAEPREQFRVLFLDRRNRLIADEVQQHGTVDHVTVYPREVVRRSIELGATAIVLVHNHPSGDPTPSSADVSMTKSVERACKALGIAVHDHVVIGRDGHSSLKQLNLF